MRRRADPPFPLGTTSLQSLVGQPGRQGGTDVSLKRGPSDAGWRQRAAAVRVVVVRNETPLFSDVLAQALKAIVGCACWPRPSNRRPPPRACRRYRPDVVVVEATQAPTAVLSDLVRPIRDAFEAAAVVLVVDQVIDDAFLVAGLEAGAAGIVDASAGMGEVVEAVRAAAEGSASSTRPGSLPPSRRRPAPGERAAARGPPRAPLGSRARGPRLPIRGKRNSEIAEELSISPRTVEKHVHHILDKPEVGSRLAAVAFATEMGGPTHPEVRGTG